MAPGPGHRRITNSDGELVKTPTELQDVLVNTFETLYSSSLLDNWSEKWSEAKTFFAEKVSPEQREQLDEDITKAEILAALTAMLRGKCPGTYGFPAEFFLSTWGCIGFLFMAVVKQVWHSGSMGELVNGSLIAPLPKGGDLTSADQWRQISLLSTLTRPLQRHWLFGCSSP